MQEPAGGRMSQWLRVWCDARGAVTLRGPGGRGGGQGRGQGARLRRGHVSAAPCSRVSSLEPVLTRSCAAAATSVSDCAPKMRPRCAAGSTPSAYAPCRPTPWPHSLRSRRICPSLHSRRHLAAADGSVDPCVYLSAVASWRYAAQKPLSEQIVPAGADNCFSFPSLDLCK